MTIQYDKFLRLGGEKGPQLPTIYPFSITMLMDDGSFQNRKINSRYDLDLRNAISVKVHKPEPLAYLMQTVRQETGVSEATLTEVFHSLQKHNALVLPEASDKDWLDQKMDKLGYSVHRYENLRKNIRNWFKDPEKYPEVNHDIKNSILTVKSVTGGRVVVLPTGHTISYSKAREIYNAMNGGWTSGTTVSVGEFHRGRITHRSYPLTIQHQAVTVGCQSVPRQAILDLANLEGW